MSNESRSSMETSQEKNGSPRRYSLNLWIDHSAAASSSSTIAYRDCVRAPVVIGVDEFPVIAMTLLESVAHTVLSRCINVKGRLEYRIEVREDRWLSESPFYRCIVVLLPYKFVLRPKGGSHSSAGPAKFSVAFWCHSRKVGRMHRVISTTWCIDGSRARRSRVAWSSTGWSLRPPRREKSS